jgi:ribosomal protein S18 acetylase RimI-like enzyme
MIIMTRIIREAFPEEFNDIALLAIEAYREYSQVLTPENWSLMQTNLTKLSAVARVGTLLVAVQDQTLVGTVIYHPPGVSDRQVFQPDWASLRMLAVAPQYRSEGIGKRLSMACIERAKQDNAKIIGLHTSELMVAARNMYQRLGFQQDIELPPHFNLRYWRYILRLIE